MGLTRSAALDYAKQGIRINAVNPASIATEGFDRALMKMGITSQDGLAINGASNGGLLLGAVVNQRPDLFAAAQPQVGVMDMLRFDKFTVGKLWVGEYGDPAREADFRNLLKYSPYHNIQSGKDYPAILATTADADDRVIPGQTFKYVAALPSLIVPFAGVAIFAYQAFTLGLPLAPTTATIAVGWIPHSLTALIEFQAYALLMFGATILGRSWLRPATIGALNHRQGYVRGLQHLGWLCLPALVLFIIGAIYEAFSLIYLLPLLVRELI